VLLCPVCGRAPSFFAPPFCPWHIGGTQMIQEEAVKAVLSNRQVRSASELADIAIARHLARERQ